MTEAARRAARHRWDHPDWRTEVTIWDNAADDITTAWITASTDADLVDSLEAWR